MAVPTFFLMAAQKVFWRCHWALYLGRTGVGETIRFACMGTTTLSFVPTDPGLSPSDF